MTIKLVTPASNLAPKNRFPMLAAGEWVGEFQIRKQLGAGGISTVYLAWDDKLKRTVALKPAQTSDREASLLAQLEHDHIVTVYETFRDPRFDFVWMALQFVAGPSLDKVVQLLQLNKQSLNGETLFRAIEQFTEAPVAIPPSAATAKAWTYSLDGIELICWIGVCIADALSHANSRGILHLDIKPANILINPFGRPMLADFNVSIATRHQFSTQTMGGTLSYMAPEQRAYFDGKQTIAPLDSRADMYALGKVLSELLSKLEIPVDWELTRCLAIATAENRDERYHSTHEFSEQLRSCLDLHQRRTRLPSGGVFAGAIQKKPFLTMTLLGMVPQLLACAVAISYGDTFVSPRLNPQQQEWYRQLNLFYSPVLFALATVAWTFVVLKNLKEWKARSQLPIDRQRALRKTLLRIPQYGAFMTSACWLPSALTYFAVLLRHTDRVELSTIIHVTALFTLSFLVALAYTFLIQQFVTLKGIYLELLNGEPSLPECAEWELKNIPSISRLMVGAAVSIPLLVNGLLAYFSGSTTLQQTAQNFRLFASTLTGLGILGVIVALAIERRISQIYIALRH